MNAALEASVTGHCLHAPHSQQEAEGKVLRSTTLGDGRHVSWPVNTSRPPVSWHAGRYDEEKLYLNSVNAFDCTQSKIRVTPFLLARSRVAGIASWAGAAGGLLYSLLGHLHAHGRL